MQSVSDGQSFRKLSDGHHAGRTLASAGLLRPHRPDRTIRAALKIMRWGQSAAGAYAAGAQLRRGEPAVIDDLGALTFAEVHGRTNRLAAALAGEGIGAGDSVALMCRNHRGSVETVVALSKLGANTLLIVALLAPRNRYARNVCHAPCPTRSLGAPQSSTTT